MHQRPDEGIHVLNIHVTTVANKCKFSNQSTKEMLKIMVLHYAVWYHEAKDWINLQDKSQLTYQALVSQCQLLESCCEMFQKAKEKPCRAHFLQHSDLLSILLFTRVSSQPIPGVHSLAITTPLATVQPMVRSATEAVVRTTLQPYAIEDPSDLPGEAEPSIPEIQAYHPSEDTTLAAGTTPAAPLNAPLTGGTGPLPTVLPAAPHAAIHAAATITTMLDTTGDQLGYQDSIKIVTVASCTDCLETQNCP